jgi:ATP-dependent Clp protease protease subunit
MAKHTGQNIEQIEKDTDRDRWMSAEEAKEYGLVDTVITNASEIPAATGVVAAAAKK